MGSSSGAKIRLLFCNTHYIPLQFCFILTISSHVPQETISPVLAHAMKGKSYLISALQEPFWNPPLTDILNQEPLPSHVKAPLVYPKNSDAATLVETPTEKSFLVRNISSTDYEAFCAGATSLSATLFNIEGKQIKSTSINGNIISVSTANLPKGIYILRLNSNNKAYQAKIAVK